MKRILFAVLFALAIFWLRAHMISEAWERHTGRSESIVQIMSDHDPLACSFDCVAYVDAANGHPEDAASTAFFPGWSSVLRGAKRAFPHVDTKVLAMWLSNILLAASAALAILLAEELDLKTPILGYGFIGAGLLFFPFGTPSSFGYGEPLFLFCYLMASLFILRKRWLWAAFWLGLLGLTRFQGVLVAGSFAFALLLWRPALSRGRLGMSLLLCGAPFLLYVLWQWNVYGDPLAFIHSQYQWGRHFTFTRALLDQAPLPKMFPILIWICLIGSIYSLGHSLRKQEFFWSFLGISTLALTEVPLFSGGLMSYGRYLSANLGLFVFSAALLSKRTRPAWRILEVLLIFWAVQALGFDLYDYLIGGNCP